MEEDLAGRGVNQAAFQEASNGGVSCDGMCGRLPGDVVELDGESNDLRRRNEPGDGILLSGDRSLLWLRDVTLVRGATCRLWCC